MGFDWWAEEDGSISGANASMRMQCTVCVVDAVKLSIGIMRTLNGRKWKRKEIKTIRKEEGFEPRHVNQQELRIPDVHIRIRAKIRKRRERDEAETDPALDSTFNFERNSSAGKWR